MVIPCPVGERKRAILQRRLDPLAAFLYRIVPQPHHVELIHIRRADINLHLGRIVQSELPSFFALSYCILYAEIGKAHAGRPKTRLDRPAQSARKPLNLILILQNPPQLMTFGMNQRRYRLTGTRRNKRRHDGMNRPATIAQNEFHRDDRAWNHGVYEIRIMNVKSSGAIGIDRVRARLFRVESGNWIRGRNKWNRGRHERRSIGAG